jgi:hypothetical protein
MKMPTDMKKIKIKLHCYECGEVIKKNEEYITLEVYDSPFDETSKTIHLHIENNISDHYRISCEEALYDEQWADFRYLDCPICKRTIVRQCPTNGWHSYVRDYDDEEICLSCYEQIIIKDGIARERFEAGKLDGMFFNEQDLKDAGYAMVADMENFYVRTNGDVEKYCSEALKYIDDGYLVVTEYEHMAIGGLEGYQTMWIKHKDSLCESFHHPEALPIIEKIMGGIRHGK